jgi:hypothetical protein
MDFLFASHCAHGCDLGCNAFVRFFKPHLFAFTPRALILERKHPPLTRIGVNTQGDYNHEYEIKGMYVHLGIEGTNSNGHGEGKDENLNMEETIRKLQNDVQSYKVDNEKLMKSKEKQEEFNMNLMQSLDIIENKLDKENGSCKSGSHRSFDEKGRSRNARRHHHHSPRHSNRRAPNRSSSSPVRKNQKRSRVDEPQGEMNKIKPPTFDGENKKDEDVKTCLLDMRKYFQLDNYSSHAEERIATYQLKGKTSMWWDKLVQVKHIKEKNVT